MTACVVCGRPVPAGSRPDRHTCSSRCRQALRRQQLSVTRSALERPGTEGGVHPLDSDPSGAGRAVLPPTSGHRDAPRSLAAIAAGIPTPVDPHLGPCRAYLTLVDPGGLAKATWRVAFGLDGGRVMQPVGPAMDRRRAAALADLLNTRPDPSLAREGSVEGALA